MIKDNNAQVSVEYLLIFAVSLLILIAFTLPVAEMGLEKTFDVSNSLNVKSEISILANAISQVYGEGHGSKQTIYLNLNKPISLKLTSSYLSGKLTLNDDKSKNFKIYYRSNLANSNLYLNKGENKIVVEWPINEEKMIVQKRL